MKVQHAYTSVKLYLSLFRNFWDYFEKKYQKSLKSKNSNKTSHRRTIIKNMKIIFSKNATRDEAKIIHLI